MRLPIVVVFILFLSSAVAQMKKDTIITPQSLEEVIFSANKFNEKKKFIAQSIEIVSKSFIYKVNAQTTGDLLTQTGKIFVQKSQQGGSSPVLRGFEASRVLLVVDGIRMNNAIYRAGHLQNIITIDQNALERVEVLYGPSSTLYGSDALGGTLHLFTLQPQVSNKSLLHADAMIRYSTANQEKTAQFQIHVQEKKWAYRGSFTYSDFDDLRMGNRYPKAYPNFGRRSSYITQTSDPLKDTIVRNDRDNVQRFSGYQQWDMLHKILFQPTKKVQHLLNIQLSNSSNIPRYDRLQDVRNGNLRFASWYYGPQKRNLFAYTYQEELERKLADRIRVTGSYQHIEESRQTREYQRFDRYDSRREKVSVAGLVMDLQKKWLTHEITYGMDFQWNDVQSRADRTNLRTGLVSPLDTRYPNGKNRVQHYGVFAQHLYKWADGKWILNDGLRFQYTHLQSNIADNSFFQLPVTEMEQKNPSVTGNVGLVHLPNQATRFSANFASGFRSPNIDDLARIFESNTAASRVVIPNADLRPEYTYSLDLSWQQKWNQVLQLEVTGFYTMFRQAIVLAPFQLKGADSIMYNGQLAAVYANQNTARAYVAGMTAQISGQIQNWSWQSSLSYTYGRYKTDPNTKTNIYQEQPGGAYALTSAFVREKPMDHIPPLFGRTSIQYQNGRFQAEAFWLYHGWKRIKDYMADGEDNEQYATPEGMPAWVTTNLRTSIKLLPSVDLQLAVENIFDRNYRHFASGFSAAGRNFLVAVRGHF
jgi:hemoglobin/transferrin/lactoferrin receptor protein